MLTTAENPLLAVSLIPFSTYVVSPADIEPLACDTVAQHEEGNFPLLLSLPVVETQKIFPGRTVKGIELEDIPPTVTTKFPDTQLGPNWTMSF
jgi:hypothetical protein